MAATPLTEKPFFLEASGLHHANAVRMPWLGVLREGAEGPGHFQPVPKGGTKSNPAAGGAGVWNMTIDILGDLGAIWIPRNTTLWSGGMYRAPMSETSKNIGPFAANASGSQRNDIVYAQVDEAGLQTVLNWVQGTPGAGDPAIPTNATQIARVAIPSGTTQLNAGNVADIRHRAYRESLFNWVLGADVRCTQNTWTTVVSSPRFYLAWPRTVMVSGSAFLMPDSTSSVDAIAAVMFRDLETSINYGTLAGSGNFQISQFTAGSGSGQRQALDLGPIGIELDAGYHQLALQVGRDGNGVIDAKADYTLNSRTIYRTWINVVL